jgi:cytochrome c553
MINNRFSTVAGVLVIFAAFAARATAAEDTPDPNTQREFGARLQVCGACHGANGVPKAATIPIIWGQDENYLAKQLHDFESGDRAVEVMAWMTKSLEPEQLPPTTVFFAKKNWPAHPTPAAATTPPPGIAVCQSCHNTDFRGSKQAEGVATPRLAGQNYGYLVEAMRRFADGERKNNETMAQLMAAIPPAQRDAMARYLSGL